MNKHATVSNIPRYIDWGLLILLILTVIWWTLNQPAPVYIDCAEYQMKLLQNTSVIIK